MTSRRSALTALASLAITGIAAAFGPVIPSPVMPAGAQAGRGLATVLPRGVSQVQLDQNLVAALPEDGEFTLLGFPLSDGRFVDLNLERFEPIAPDAVIQVGTLAADGSWLQDAGVQRPVVRNFRGTIAGQPDSVAFLSFASTSNVGLIVTDANETFSMSDGTVDESGPLVVTNMQELPEDAIEWARFQCGNAGAIALPGAAAMPPETGLPRAGCRLFKLAIDTDFEFHDRFSATPNKTTNALTYLSQQMGAFSTVYYNQLNVDATLQYLRLWKTKPASGYPYKSNYATVGGMGGFLADVKTRWLSNATDMAQARDLVLGLSGQDLGGGVANGFRVVCNNNTGYCVAGSLALAFPYPLVNKGAQNWDPVVFMHEIGHCFGAYHPHDTGDDDCFKPDYSGIGACTMRAQGTIMSYCHLCPGGMTNINFRFSDRNKGGTQIGAGLPTYSCMASCGPTNSATLTASSCTPNEVNLSWSAVSGNKGYRIYRDDGVTVPVPMIKEVAMNSVGYKDTPIAAGKRFTYFVRALLMRNDSTNGNAVFEGPPSNDAPGGTAMAAPTGLAAVRDPATGNVSLSWAAASGVTAYQVYRKLGADAETKIGTDVATNAFVDSTIPAGRLGTYRVTAGSGSCESASSESVQAGAGVTDLTVTVGTRTDGVKLDWTAVDGATSYKVFRLLGNNLAGTPSELLGPNPATNTFTDSTAIAGKFYTYAVKAVLAGPVDSDLGKRAAGWRNANAPTALSATDGTRGDGVQLTWTAPAGDISDYEVSRSIGGGPATVVTGATPPTGTSFLDTSALANLTYTYTVKARTTAGRSPSVLTAASASDEGWRSDGPPSDVMASDGDFTTEVVVSFRPVPGIGTYKVFRGLASAPDAAMTQVATVFASPYRDTTASVGVLFKYGLKSSTEAGDTAMSTIDTGYRGIGAPATVRASNGTFSDRVEVSWTAVPGSTAYKLYRGTAGTPAGAPLVTTSDLSYVDTTGTAGVLYAYSVVCDTPAGPSRSSTTAGGWRNVSPPSDVAASDGTFSDRVRVTWTPIVATPKYAVYRRLGTQSATRLGVVTGTSFDDRTARPGTLYTYMVRSVVVPGESRDSLPNNGWRLNPNGPNPDTPGGGSGGGMPRLASVDPAGFGGGSSAAFVGGGAGSIERGGDIDGGIPSEDPLMQRIEPSDPAWQLDCAHATREELAAALERGSRDSDADGEPDLCQRERGDLDLNGRVDAGDIVLLLLLVGESDPVMGDFDHDGCVDRADLDMLQDLVTAQQALDDLEAELEAPGMPGAPSRD